MTIKIKTEAMEFIFEDEKINSNTFYSNSQFQTSIDYMKQLIEKVAIESQNIAYPKESK